MCGSGRFHTAVDAVYVHTSSLSPFFKLPGRGNPHTLESALPVSYIPSLINFYFSYSGLGVKLEVL